MLCLYIIVKILLNLYIYICIYINTSIYIYLGFASGQDRNTWLLEKALDLKGRTVAEKRDSLVDLCARGKVSGGLTCFFGFMYLSF